MRTVAFSLALAGAVLILVSHSVAYSISVSEWRDPNGYRYANVDTEKRTAVGTNLRLIGAIVLGVGLFRGLGPAKES